jgi:hypothetical protein
MWSILLPLNRLGGPGGRAVMSVSTGSIDVFRTLESTITGLNSSSAEKPEGKARRIA